MRFRGQLMRFRKTAKYMHFVKRHKPVASEALTVTDDRGRRQTLLTVSEVNLKTCAHTNYSIRLVLIRRCCNSNDVSPYIFNKNGYA